jgi:hypothetical protein
LILGGHRRVGTFASPRPLEYWRRRSATASCLQFAGSDPPTLLVIWGQPRPILGENEANAGAVHQFDVGEMSDRRGDSPLAFARMSEEPIRGQAAYKCRQLIEAAPHC